MKLIQKGDKNGLKNIYEQYNPVIFSVVYGVLKNKEDSQDVVAEFFIKLWGKSESYRFGEKHKKWLATIAYNMAVDFLRLHKKEVLVDISPPEKIHQPSLEGEVCLKIAFEQALQMLDETEQQIINLKILCDLTFKDTAKLLNIPLGTVTWKYQNAIKTLRRCEYE
jgi:RNA polymerase sigma-70 factor (ECF subfamily)